MNILIYGTKKEKELLIQHIKSEPSTAFCIVNNAYTDDYDEYIDLLREIEILEGRKYKYILLENKLYRCSAKYEKTSLKL